MQRELAEVVSSQLLACSGKLDESVALAQGILGQEDLQSYRRQVGEVLGLFYIEILSDIYAEHPDLQPEGMR